MLSLNHSRKPFILVFALALGLAGCSGATNAPAPVAQPQNKTSAPSSVTQEQAKPVLEVGAQVGKVAPDFKAAMVDGGQFALASVRGRPAALFFMAADGCTGCLAEAQALAEVKKTYGDAISVVAVDMSSAPIEILDAFKNAAGNPAFIWLRDGDARLTKAHRVSALDTTFILDRGGKITFRDEASTGVETLKQELSKLQP